MDRQERLKMSNELSIITVHVYIYMQNILLFDVVLLSVLPFTTDRVICDETISSVFNNLFILQFFQSNLMARHLHWAQSKSFICSSYYCCFLLLVVGVIVDAAVVVSTHITLSVVKGVRDV